VWGSTKIRKHLWNREFAKGRWNCLDETPEDCVYCYVEKYCKGGSILDLGCGSGNTGNELDVNKYQDYTGVDVSDVAIQKAMERTKRVGRCEKNHYFQSDIYTYLPRKKYDVILFRDSIYYIPQPRIDPTLDRYSNYLTEHGVFIVRIFDGENHARVVSGIEHSFEIAEKYVSPNTNLAGMKQGEAKPNREETIVMRSQGSMFLERTIAP